MSERFPNANYPEAYPEADMGKATGVPVNATRREIQSVSTDGTGGTFTLTFLGVESGNIAWDATAGAVETALELVSTIGDVSVTGGDLPAAVLVEFLDPLGNVPLMVADDTLLTGETVGTVVAQTQTGHLEVTQATGAPL